jgi:hypothetical protein
MYRVLLVSLVLFLVFSPALKTQSTPSIPEEARRQFIIATTLFKEAKTPADFLLVVNHLKQATDLAPQWPDARFNLAIAHEAAADFASAVVDLRIYLQFKLSPDDAHTVQDKIYVLEAKAEQAGQNIPPPQSALTPAPAPVVPQNESYDCPTTDNLKTIRQTFTFDFSTHTVNQAIVWENATQRLKNRKFDESGSQLILREGCPWSAKPLGCATVNRKALTLSIYAWGTHGGEDAPSGDQSGGSRVVVYDCHIVK